ncbi:MAG: DUF4136 domain-containing protein [Gammaproteobacteria bacterium]
MKKMRLAMPVVVALLIAACTSTPKAKYDHNPAVDFSQYRTYTWITESGLINDGTQISPINVQRLQQSVDNQLMLKGYRRVDKNQNPDFAVNFTVGSREKIDVHDYPTTYGGAGWGWGHPYYGGVSYGTQTRVDQYTEGTISVDIFDVATKQPAWHGTVSGRIKKQHIENPAETISGAVAEIMAGFPPGIPPPAAPPPPSEQGS